MLAAVAYLIMLKKQPEIPNFVETKVIAIGKVKL